MGQVAAAKEEAGGASTLYSPRSSRSLDISTHQLILNELALNLASQSVEKIDANNVGFLRTSAGSSKVGSKLSSAEARTKISLALFASSLSSGVQSTSNTVDTSIDEHLKPVLSDIIALITNIESVEIEQDMAWTDWSMPDQLAFALVSSLLTIAKNANQHRDQCTRAILTLAEKLTARLTATSGDAHLVATHVVPLFHGLYRAVASIIFPWSLDEFSRLTTAIAVLSGSAQIVRRLNDSLLILPEQHSAVAQGARATRRKAKEGSQAVRDDDASEGSFETFFSGDEDEEVTYEGGFTFDNADDATNDYCQALLSHYRRSGRPLSGHFVVCGAVEMLASVLAQALAIFAKPPIESFADYQKQGLDLDRIDPARLSQADRFDTDVNVQSSDPNAINEDNSAATAKAWSSLLRYAVNAVGEKDKLSSSAVTNGAEQEQQKSTGSRIISAVTSAFSGAGDQNAIKQALHVAGRAYHDIQRFIEKEGQKQAELFIDLYALEILSEALKLGALSSVALGCTSGASVDNHVLVRVRTLLSEQAVVVQPLLQGAALQCVGLLAHNFPPVALPMTTQLRRFVTLPLPMFDVVPGPNGSTPTVAPILASAAKCMNTCVTIAPGDDLLVSTMYTLLNYLGKDSSTGGFAAGGAAGSGLSVRSGAAGRSISGRDMAHSTTQTNFASRSDEQKRRINTSTICMVSRLALESGKPDVIALTVSMLLQRLRTADPVAERAILNNLVPLALAGSRSAFIDVIRAFTQVSRTSLVDTAERKAGLSSSCNAAQLKLARGLSRLNEADEVTHDSEGKQLEGGRKEMYLVELLQLFAEKGIALQTTSAASKASKDEIAELTADLADLLPVLAALLSHDDIKPQLEPTTEMVSLFRNMWFLSVLFGYATPQMIRRTPKGAPPPTTESTRQLALIGEALSIISLKTPTLVPESAHSYLESDLEYNSVLKRDFSHSSIDQQRKLLASVIPTHSSEIRGFSFAQVTFLMTIYDLECARSSMGRPSMILWYFVNEGLNKSPVVGAMEAIADKVVESFIDDLSTQVNDHSLDLRVSSEVKNLLLGSCHRVAKVRQVSRSFLDKLIGAYPSLLCDPELVVTMLEVLTLLRQACECEFKDEYFPQYRFRSARADVDFELSDSYVQRQEILSQFLQRTRAYLTLLLGRAPVELQGILQRYLSTFDDGALPGNAELGKSVALDFARSMPASARADNFLPPLGGWRADASSSFVGELSAKSTYLGEMTGIHLALAKGLVELQKDPVSSFSENNITDCKKQLESLSKRLTAPGAVAKAILPFAELRRLLYRSAALAVALDKPDYDLLHYIVSIPIRVFTPEAITTASHVWTWVIGERPEVETKIMVEVTVGWSATVKSGQGLFSKSLKAKHPLLEKTEMSAFDRSQVEAELATARRLFSPHLTLIHLISSRYQAFRYRDPTMVLALVRLIQRSAHSTNSMSTHPLAREARFSLVVFGFRLVQGSRLDGLVEYQLRAALYRVAFSWFATAPQWSFGSNRLQIRSEMNLMKELLEVLRIDSLRANFVITSFPASVTGSVRMPNGSTVDDAVAAFADRRALLQLLVENELSRFGVWGNPLAEQSRGPDFAGEISKTLTDATLCSMANIAWRVDPHIAVQMVLRYQSPALKREVGRLVRAQPHKVVDCHAALELLLEDHLKLAAKEGTDLRWVLYWASISPVEAIHLFQPEYNNDPMVLQYAMRTLEQHSVELVFFYVPQVVQALRDDAYGYVEQFIFETSKISQLFCHQIIWNMKANSYKDDNAEVPDAMKPTLDRMVESIVQALSGEAQNFYEREFGFFNEVTSISGKLKPYIRKSKQEKKAKIDEEMALIKVDKGVYLPSNPNGVVVDLDRKSGRPLQSHAKCPFMATFVIDRSGVDDDDADNAIVEAAADSTEKAADPKSKKAGTTTLVQSIFKVGDDCRQDVLALQVIAMFKNIFTTVGLDLYLNPYRVTATGPGCGVIDVVPNATSRDEMGRAKINNLLAFFVGKYGNVDSITFQKARLNFIQSMAAYSMACYILQIKDRHNGNIMIDGDGHIIHIDFGFLFDIGPGGMKFEPNSFKLSHEMVEVMGGAESQGFRIFSELVVKSFLAIRPYAEQIIEVCSLMLGTDLPSFKGTPTIDRLRDRFKLEMNERQAAKHAQYLIKDGFENPRSTFYDGFQKLQNGIPY